MGAKVVIQESLVLILAIVVTGLSQGAILLNLIFFICKVSTRLFHFRSEIL